MNSLINSYIENLHKKNLSQNTIEAYVRDLENFKTFLQKKNLIITYVDKLNITAYIQGLIKSGKSNSSIVRNIITLRSFYKHLLDLGYVNDNPALQYEIPRVSRSMPQILSLEEVELLLSTPNISTYKGLRDKAMLELMYATGIKVTEMLNLTTDQLNIKLRYIQCTGSKGRERIIPLGAYAVEHIENYLNIRYIFNHNDNNILFLNTKGLKMTRQGFWKIVKFYTSKVQINKEINLYTLRHSFAVHLIENGADMKSVQELLGYRDISAIQMYLELTAKSKLADVYNKFHPRA
jgi:integrase/recombinase XerD